MTEVKVLYFSELKDISKKKEEIISLGENTFVELIRILISKYPRLKEIIWDDSLNDLNDNISLVINHRVIRDINLETYHFKENDIVAFLLPVAGG